MSGFLWHVLLLNQWNLVESHTIFVIETVSVQPRGATLGCIGLFVHM